MKIGLKYYLIIIFIILFSSSILLLNKVVQSGQKDIGLAYENLKIEDFLSGIDYTTQADSINAEKLLNDYLNARAASHSSLIKMKIYSWVWVIVLFILGISVFIFIVNAISKPLYELRRATDHIAAGNFNVRLSEKGIPELRDLKKSFNMMSEELETTQQKLLASEKELLWKDLSRILAHEIKNPLTPIKLALERLEEKYIADKDAFQNYFPSALEVINNEVDNLLAISRNFSDFARPVEANRTIFAPSALITEILEGYRESFPIETQMDETAHICFDRNHFYQIFTNLLQNALDACSDKGCIHIRLSSKIGRVLLIIEDNGSGILQEDLPRIFDPYFTKKQNGTGLGLSVVKKLTTANSGDIWVDSTPNEGTKFILTLERSDESIDY